jgi:hypothetical protein
MNIRFATNSIRARLSSEEFAELCAGKSMALEVDLPHGHAFRFKINQSSAAEWQFDSDPTGLWLSVPRAELSGLAQGLPSKEGLTHSFAAHGGELNIDLEVDVKRSASKPSRQALCE